MSEKKNDAKAPASDAAATGAAEGPRKKSPIVPIAIVAVLMAVEGAAIYFFVAKSGPQAAQAHTVAGHDEPNLDASVEIPLIEERFQNLQTGRVWIWDTNIVLKVRAKDEEFVEKQLESRAAEIQEGVSTIFKRAQHAHLKEAGLETLNRQVAVFIRELVGKDAEGRERVERVMIPKCRGFPAD